MFVNCDYEINLVEWADNLHTHTVQWMTGLFNEAHAFTKPNNPQTNLWGTIFPRPINSIWHLITRRVDGNLFALCLWFLGLITKYFWGDEAHFAGRTFPQRFSCTSKALHRFLAQLLLLIGLYSHLITFNGNNHCRNFCVRITEWNWSAIVSSQTFTWKHSTTSRHGVMKLPLWGH